MKREGQQSLEPQIDREIDTLAAREIETLSTQTNAEPGKNKKKEHSLSIAIGDELRHLEQQPRVLAERLEQVWKNSKGMMKGDYRRR